MYMRSVSRAALNSLAAYVFIPRFRMENRTFFYICFLSLITRAPGHVSVERAIIYTHILAKCFI